MINLAILDFSKLKWPVLKGNNNSSARNEGIMHYVDEHFHFSPKEG